MTANNVDARGVLRGRCEISQCPCFEFINAWPRSSGCGYVSCRHPAINHAVAQDTRKCREGSNGRVCECAGFEASPSPLSDECFNCLHKKEKHAAFGTCLRNETVTNMRGKSRGHWSRRSPGLRRTNRSPRISLLAPRLRDPFIVPLNKKRACSGSAWSNLETQAKSIRSVDHATAFNKRWGGKRSGAGRKNKLDRPLTKEIQYTPARLRSTGVCRVGRVSVAELLVPLDIAEVKATARRLFSEKYGTELSPEGEFFCITASGVELEEKHLSGEKNTVRVYYYNPYFSTFSTGAKGVKREFGNLLDDDSGGSDHEFERSGQETNSKRTALETGRFAGPHLALNLDETMPAFSDLADSNTNCDLATSREMRSTRPVETGVSTVHSPGYLLSQTVQDYFNARAPSMAACSSAMCRSAASGSPAIGRNSSLLSVSAVSSPHCSRSSTPPARESRNETQSYSSSAGASVRSSRLSLEQSDDCANNFTETTPCSEDTVAFYAEAYGLGKRLANLVIDFNQGDSDAVASWIEKELENGSFKTVDAVESLYKFHEGRFVDCRRNRVITIDRMVPNETMALQLLSLFKSSRGQTRQTSAEEMARPVHVLFEGENGVGSGLDTVYVSLLQEHVLSSYFEGEIDHLIPKKCCDVSDDELRLIGSIMGHIVCQDQPVLVGVSPVFKSVLAGVPSRNIAIVSKDLPDTELRAVIDKLNDGVPAEALAQTEKQVLSQAVNEVECERTVRMVTVPGEEVCWLPRPGCERDLAAAILYAKVIGFRRDQYDAIASGFNDVCHVVDFIAKGETEAGRNPLYPLIDRLFPSAASTSIKKDDVLNNIHFSEDDMAESDDNCINIRMALEELFCRLDEGENASADVVTITDFWQWLTGARFRYPGDTIAVLSSPGVRTFKVQVCQKKLLVNPDAVSDNEARNNFVEACISAMKWDRDGFGAL